MSEQEPEITSVEVGEMAMIELPDNPHLDPEYLTAVRQKYGNYQPEGHHS